MKPQQLTRNNNQIKVDGNNNIIIQDAQGLTLKVFELEQISELRSLLAGVPELLLQLQQALAPQQELTQLTPFPPLEKTVYGREQDLLETPLQLAPNWTLLYTSRDQLPNVEALLLDVLDPSEARNLFYAHYQLEKDESLLTPILKAVEYHTFTLELLAKTAQKLHYRLAELSQAMEAHGIDISAGESVPIDAQHQPKARIENIRAYLLSIFDIAPLSTAQVDILRPFSLFP